jgi:hypothetical protein
LFTVHKDIKCCTGAIITLSKGAIVSDSTKQKVSAQSLTESKMIAIDSTILKILWTNHFIKAQRHKMNGNLIYYNNISTMKKQKAKYRRKKKISIEIRNLRTH